jgi:hypothetical protein
MAIVDSAVKVTEPAVGSSSIDNTTTTTGAGSVKRQTVSIGDPEFGDLRAFVKDTPADPTDPALCVRFAGSITVSAPVPNYDSPIATLPAAVGVVTAVDTNVAGIFLSNITDQVQKVTVKDGNDEVYLDQYPLAARKSEVIAFAGMKFVGGIKWFAGNAASVRGQIKGDQ